MAGCNNKDVCLQASGNGEPCAQHHCCGIFVIPIDTFMFKTTVADGMGFDEDGKVMPEETIKAALVPNRIELCTI